MKDNKLISTVIPTFNRKLYLKKAIESCLDQTINHEIIVSNHWGSDGIDEMVQQFHGKIKYIKKKIMAHIIVGLIVSWKQKVIL